MSRLITKQIESIIEELVCLKPIDTNLLQSIIKELDSSLHRNIIGSRCGKRIIQRLYDDARKEYYLLDKIKHYIGRFIYDYEHMHHLRRTELTETYTKLKEINIDIDESLNEFLMYENKIKRMSDIDLFTKEMEKEDFEKKTYEFIDNTINNSMANYYDSMDEQYIMENIHKYEYGHFIKIIFNDLKFEILGLYENQYLYSYTIFDDSQYQKLEMFYYKLIEKCLPDINMKYYNINVLENCLFHMLKNCLFNSNAISVEDCFIRYIFKCAFYKYYYKDDKKEDTINDKTFSIGTKRQRIEEEKNN